MKKNKEKALLAIREKEQEAYVNNMNMNFFSNISHEFRTPLTIISAPINTLIKHLNLSKEDKSLFHLVQRNIKRMLRLVNQLMDLSKLEADTLKLEVSQLDIIHQIKETLEMYIIYAKEKRIIFETEGLDGTFYMMTDSDKLEKILGNILSNALKYTPAKGVIKLKFDIISNEHALQIFPDIMANNEAFYAFIQIEDSGPGIPEDKLEDIFLRYYQIDNKQKAGYNWGTGIGLYYTKQLLLLHHGKIKAENSPNGGALFSFILPADSKAYSPNEIGVSTQNPGKETLASSLPLPVELPEKEKNKHNKTILIVDDDIEISFYLNQLLTSNYNVINKYDGEEAFNALPQIKPDLIVSDILMPGMNGYELCQKIKKDISFCHIPVILLTAKTLMEEQIKGFHTGANAYVTKPFKPEILLALIDSQLKNKQLLSDFLMSNTSTKSETDNILSPKDKNFMDRLYALMEEELDNPEMNIARIAERLQMSRTKFYHKIKGLTGENPNTLIKKYKLNRASEFLVEGIHNISEIAELTGFVSLSHFSVSFKKQFNCKPSEFKG
jgi:DNA-binding response OmpR family regulator/nitrogen-specific signal transduction histidine kinase